MIYLLDTNAWASYLNRRDSPVACRIQRTEPADIRLCSVVKAELYYGAYKSARREANLALLARLFDRFSSLPFDDRAAEVYGRIRSQLATYGTPIGPHDLMIAAIALANALTIITHNAAEFGRVPDLAIEDWESDT